MHKSTNSPDYITEREKIPALDLKKLFQELDLFIANLIAAYPEKREKTENIARILDGILADISLNTDDLRAIQIDLSERQRATLSAVKQQLPEETLIVANKYWMSMLLQIVSIIDDLDQHGILSIATIKNGKYEVNINYLEKLITLFETMIESYYQINGTLPSDKQKADLGYQKLKDRLMTEYKEIGEPLAGNFEDQADTDIDEIYLKDFLENLEKNTDIREITRKLLFLLRIHFLHLKNSLAGQKTAAAKLYLTDIQNGTEKEPKYYDEDEGIIFDNEVSAFALKIAMLRRCIISITNSQKFAETLQK